MAFLYALCDPDSGELRYVGKADDPRKRLLSHGMDSIRRRTPLYDWMRKLGRAPELIVIREVGQDWPRHERQAIAAARSAGYRLLNLADGGDQPFASRETCQRGARTAFQKRNPVVHDLLRRFGQNLHWLKQRGTRPDLIEKAERAQSVLRAMSPAQQEAFAVRWVSRHG